MRIIPVLCLTSLLIILPALCMDWSAACASDEVRVIDPGEYSSSARDVRLMYDSKYFADCCFSCRGICLKEVWKGLCREGGGRVVFDCSDCVKAECSPETTQMEDGGSKLGEFLIPRKKPQVEATLVDHPETDGSVSAREFLIEIGILYPDDLPKKVWKNPKRSLREGQRKLRKARKLRDIRAEQDALTELGTVYYLMGLFQEAEDSYRKALKLSSESGNEPTNALLLNNIGAVLAATGQYETAEDQYKKGLSESRSKGSASAVAMILNNMAIMAKNQGRFRQAVEYLQQSLNVDQKETIAKVLMYNNLGNVYRNWGELELAVICYRQVLAIVDQKGDKRGKASVLAKLGDAYAALGDTDEALKSYQDALSIQRKIKVPTYRLNNLIGSLYLDKGAVNKAEPFITKGKYNSSLGRLSLMKSDYRSAERYFRKLERSAGRFNRARDLLTAYTGLGKTYESLKRFRSAEQYYAKAVDLCEKIRSSCLLTERRNFFASRINGFQPLYPAKGLIRIRLLTGRGDKTVLPSEVTRARDFSDRISQRCEKGKLGVPPQALAKEESLVNKLAGLYKARSAVPKERHPKRFNSISAQIAVAEKDIRAFREIVAKEYPKYAAVRWSEPVSLKRAAINPDEYIVVFDLLAHGLGVKLIKGKKVVLSYFQSCDLNKLRNEILTFRRCFETVDLAGFSPELGAELYKQLLEQVLAEVPDGKPVTIIPDGELALLPFGALVVGGTPTRKSGDWGDYPDGLRYLADVHPVSLRHSLTALTLSRGLRKENQHVANLLVVADPVFQADDPRSVNAAKAQSTQTNKEFFVNLMDAIKQDGAGSFTFRRLARTGDLAQELKNIFGEGTDVFTGMAATKERIETTLAGNKDQYRWIVFATHAFAGSNVPGIMEPCLVLTCMPKGTDGFLRMTEVLAMNTNADLVALTACQTGEGQYLAGEGILSLGRAFQCAGARAALVSLWSVAENSSVRFVQELFRFLGQGRASTEAWQLARKELQKAGFHHPFYWAPFVLIGEAD